MPSSVDRPPVMTPEQVRMYVPRALRLTAAWGWRLLVVAGMVLVIWHVGGLLSSVVIPIFIALMITAALFPLHRFMTNHKFPNWLSATLSLLLMILVLGGLLTLVGTQLASQGPEFIDNATAGVQVVMQWLADGPLHISQDQVQSWINDVLASLQASQAQIAGAVASFGGTLGVFFTGLTICIFAAFFFLMDGRNMTDGFAKMVPDYLQDSVLPPFARGWNKLVSYMGASVVVAFIDGIGAGVGALILGSSMYLAIGVLTFLLAFIPLLGAFLAGAIATITVFVSLGPVKAIIMLVIYVSVIFIEGNVLQPMILGKAAQIHPLIVLTGIAIGGSLAGIPGALFAIPIVAFASGMMRPADEEKAEDDAKVAEGKSPTADKDEDEPSDAYLADDGLASGATAADQ